MKTYLEMNEKVADILQHGGKIEQYAAQYIEELRKENAETQTPSGSSGKSFEIV